MRLKLQDILGQLGDAPTRSHNLDTGYMLLCSWKHCYTCSNSEAEASELLRNLEDS